MNDAPEPSSLSAAAASAAEIRLRSQRQFTLRSLFAVMLIAALMAFAYRLLDKAVLPALAGAAAAIAVHFLGLAVRDHEQRQVGVLGAYTLVAWLTASAMLKDLSDTDRVIAAGTIPAAVLGVWGFCRWWRGADGTAAT